MIQTDNRSLEDLTLAIEAPEDTRETEATFVRSVLSICGVQIAEDVGKLGCTGVVGHSAQHREGGVVADGPVETAQRVHMGMAGSGCPLPCFVGPDRYCLVHKTVGGLQDGQRAYYTEHIGLTSRELTPEERKSTKALESARRTDERTAYDRLVTGAADPGSTDAEAVHAPSSYARSWICPEHKETFWPCRFCVASEIVKGDLVPVFLLRSTSAVPVEADSIDDTVAALQGEGASLFVRAAVWKRKLTRE